MKYKFPNGLTIELRENEKNIAERYGAKPVDEDTELEALRAQAKELGIRNAHNMGKEKLLEKIAEVNKE